MGERGVAVDHVTLYRWIQRYAPELEKRVRWYQGHRSSSTVNATEPSGLGTWQHREIQLGLDRQAMAEAKKAAPFPVIPVLLPGLQEGIMGMSTQSEARNRIGSEGDTGAGSGKP